MHIVKINFLAVVHAVNGDRGAMSLRAVRQFIDMMVVVVWRSGPDIVVNEGLKEGRRYLRLLFEHFNNVMASSKDQLPTLRFLKYVTLNTS